MIQNLMEKQIVVEQRILEHHISLEKVVEVVRGIVKVRIGAIIKIEEHLKLLLLKWQISMLKI